jgi:urease accessory protein
MAFARRGARNVLARSRCTHPLRALAPFHAGDGSLCLMILNPSGGMAGGDRLRIGARIGAGAAATLITASASKVYRTTGAPACQKFTATLEPGATLEYLPDHTIPHPGSILHQSAHITMAPGSRLIFYDAIAAGRVGRGERWQFKEIRSETIIRRGTRPIYISRANIVPDAMPLDQIGWMENFNYLATVVVAGDSDNDWSALGAQLDAAIVDSPEISGGVSEIAGGGCVVRLLTLSADTLNNIAAILWGIARRNLLGQQAFSLRKY